MSRFASFALIASLLLCCVLPASGQQPGEQVLLLEELPQLPDVGISVPENDFLVALKWYSRGDYEAAWRTLEPLAQEGDARSQWLLATLYQHGLGLAPSAQDAAIWYERAAQQGVAEAQEALAFLYATGSGLSRNIPRAFEWYEKAARQGNPQAQFALAFLLAATLESDDVSEEVHSWYRQAAEQGHLLAQYNLATLYINEPQWRNETEAARWYESAARQGYCRAQYNLALLYSQGLGIERSEERALYWYERAAQQGEPAAMNNLGAIYANGFYGVEKDLVKAYVYFHRAAAAAHERARINRNALLEQLESEALLDAQRILQQHDHVSCR
ncbi:Sel1 domain protein repeat-containing protein [Desulfurispirillum indicum S5]|uniref:Sel1 domain protein repeat-containing protein n=1 Tax=Desulfurispirillum indicum (strain ATCC BAA-1389 / DSM 22839 / S5) TaxID=653733 RepID=E6W1B9_DESIS|nr:Sel1 domain protein repeat-containing protein [Desulfurispirillum indicum S5]